MMTADDEPRALLALLALAGLLYLAAWLSEGSRPAAVPGAPEPVVAEGEAA